MAAERAVAIVVIMILLVLTVITARGAVLTSARGRGMCTNALARLLTVRERRQTLIPGFAQLTHIAVVGPVYRAQKVVCMKIVMTN